MDVLLYNSAVCRLCGEENENGTLLYSCEESEENVCDLINTYLPLKVSDDGQLPRTICPGCTIQVEATVEFLNLIIKGQKIIRELHSNEKAYRKSLIQKLDTSGTEFPEKLYYEINTSNGVYQVEHPMSLQTAGLDKPKRKRGRPPKKPKSPEEMAAEAAEREKETARIKASREANSKRELTGKRRRKTPTRFNEAVQGKELERIFKEEGVIDAEESDPDSKPDVEPEPKSPVNREPEIIGHLETSGELVVVVQGKGRGRPKGRMRPTREQCAICGMEFSCVGRYMSHIAQHGPVVYQCTQCDLRAVTRLQFTQHQTDTGHTGQNVIQLKNEKAEQEKQDEAPIESDPLSIEDVAQPSHLSPASLNLMPTSAKVESDAKALEDVFVKGLVNECRSDGDGDSSIVDVESSPGAGGDKAAKNDANTSTEAVDDEEEIEVEVKGKAKLKCNHCDKTFSSRQSKSMHIKAMHKGERPYVCKECGAAFPYPRSLSIHALSHRRTNPSKGFACDLCGKVLNHPSSVVYHKEAEHAGRQYVCIKCGKGFKHKQLLQRHQLVHTQVRPYTCQTCGASFKTKPNLMNHQLLHTGVKKFTCEICKQKFAHKTSLTLHMRLHTGLKPFSCNVCGKSFSQKGNLSEHSRIHTGEKPYKCTICPRSFTTSSQHRLHLRRHSADRPHECTHCGKRFLSRESWRVHMRREAGARAHRCNACPRAFCERWALLKHQRKHTGERPFRCPHCPRAFADCSNLNKHKKQVHKQQISLLVSENQRATAAPAAAGPQPARGPKAEAESGPEAEMERVIYVTYDVEDESGFHILEEDMAEEASNLEHVQCKVLQPSPLYSGQSLLVHDQQLSLQHQVRVLSPEPASPPPAQEHMAVTDEQGNPLHFTMQDGTKLAITSADGKSLQVITQDGRTIPVEINGYNEEEIDEDVISQDGCTIPVEINDFNEGEIGEEVETDTVVHLELQNTMEANGSAPVANYFTIV